MPGPPGGAGRGRDGEGGRWPRSTSPPARRSSRSRRTPRPCDGPVLRPPTQSWRSSRAAAPGRFRWREAAAATVEHRLAQETRSAPSWSTTGVAGAGDLERAACVVILEQRPPGDRAHVLTLSVTNGAAAGAHVRVAVPTGWEGHALTAPRGRVERPELSHQVVRLALEEARARQVPLRFLHVWRYSDAFDDVVFGDGARAAHEDELAGSSDGLADLLAKYDDVATELVLRHDHPADVLVEESRTAGLLVLGRHQSAISRAPHLGSSSGGC